MKVESTSVKKDKEKKARDKKGKPGKFNIKYLGGALFKRTHHHQEADRQGLQEAL